ncbi:metallophosphoesterase [Phaeobacter sp.]|uniref:metallophosphoesterase family protein n=1 Tax=Phaeobacter sp. TaxID=1902409 RepID=UPI0025EEA9CE|nr:metallophosphoesterase [Phaeobacter sp.]
MTLRFLHCSDLHLGKRFGQFDEDTRAALQLARQASLDQIANIAQRETVSHVLVAGDTFDTETPSSRVIRQALASMASVVDVQWWIIPGNHDSGAAEPLWAEMARHKSANVHLLLSAEPVHMAAGATLLPAPCMRRFAGHDRTAWMDQAPSPDGDLRIGLAHGAVLDFDRDQSGAETIASDRAKTARLDYLALGDWHGEFELDARSRYCGTPERDRFKHAGRGGCLLVELDAPGRPPRVRRIETGQFDWCDLTLELTSLSDVAAEVQRILPAERAEWTRTLIRLQARGWVSAAQHAALMDLAAEVAPAFHHLSLDTSALQIEHRAEDLDQIARSGALRVAAEQLLADSQNTVAAEPERAVAAAALNRLYAFVRKDAE